ncbi:hypothetical protein M426DRAFT_319745 [Hypoxylon sp. CI-4A]|nr:hypothetical protein M426DRAFT_319745 [Hypoxylon sp. CI-4A]
MGSCAPFVLLLGILACLARSRSGVVYGQSLARRSADIPGPDNFFRHRYPTVVALGDYVYIDGGELSHLPNGTETNTTQSGLPLSSYAENSTLSLSLKESWTNDTVEFRSISKRAPPLDQQVYWSDPSNGAGALYTWGGMAVGSASPPADDDLWRFNADGTGGGTWTISSEGDYRDFVRLVRPVGAAFTQGNQVGYALGGQATSKTDSSIQKEYPGYALPGLVSYDFQTGNWTNSTTTPNSYGALGTSLNGLAEFVPFGPNGLLLFLGGAEAPIDATNETIVQTAINGVYLYDPSTGKWYKQPITGDRPSPFERACSVGVPGPNNTYEIYIYGGTSTQGTGKTSADVHVLSLPGFVFFDAHSPGTPRADHACAAVGKGKRQMLSYGGINGEPGLPGGNTETTADPWKQGLGVYDMSEMTWKDSFDPDAADYESPAVVTDWYANGGMDKVTWCDEGLKGLFINDSAIAYGAAGNETDSSSDDTHKKVGIIVGSTVGGTIALAIIGAVLFWVLRKRSRERSQSRLAETIDEYRPEPWPKDSPRLRSVTPGTMVSAPTPTLIEIHGTTRGELPAEDVEWTYELPAPTPKLRSELPDRKYST